MRSRHANKSYDVFLTHAVERIGMLWVRDGTDWRDLDSLTNANSEKLVFATNGGMFNPDRSPVGLYMEDSKMISALDTSSHDYGNFYLKPNGVFALTKSAAYVMETRAYSRSALNDVVYATQSGPLLVMDGDIHPKFTKGSSNLNIRSGVGVTADGEVIFIISNEPINFYDFALLFRDKYNCDNALYLDGVISKMYLAQKREDDTSGRFGPMIYMSE